MQNKIVFEAVEYLTRFVSSKSEAKAGKDAVRQA